MHCDTFCDQLNTDIAATGIQVIRCLVDWCAPEVCQAGNYPKIIPVIRSTGVVGRYIRLAPGTAETLKIRNVKETFHAIETGISSDRLYLFICVHPS